MDATVSLYYMDVISAKQRFCYFSSLKSKMPIQVALKLKRQLKAVFSQEMIT